MVYKLYRSIHMRARQSRLLQLCGEWEIFFCVPFTGAPIRLSKIVPDGRGLSFREHKYYKRHIVTLIFLSTTHLPVQCYKV